ncbi:MAG: hypothetical protein FJ145_00550 [Deltaproteobacteria bacterium]|nr:hypothetical protein [Deltaproteobacteria bacterium]
MHKQNSKETRNWAGALVCVALLLFLFVLPLHEHAAETGTQSNECACVHGQRIQLGLPAATVSFALVARFSAVAAVPACRQVSRSLFSQGVRAPPAVLAA